MYPLPSDVHAAEEILDAANMRRWTAENRALTLDALFGIDKANKMRAAMRNHTWQHIPRYVLADLDVDDALEDNQERVTYVNTQISDLVNNVKMDLDDE